MTACVLTPSRQLLLGDGCAGVAYGALACAVPPGRGAAGTRTATGLPPGVGDRSKPRETNLPVIAERLTLSLAALTCAEVTRTVLAICVLPRSDPTPLPLAA